MRSYQKEMLEAVNEINDELMDKCGFNSYSNIQSSEFILLLSFYEAIDFYICTKDFKATFKIFNSENDGRVFYEETDSYETWSGYLRRKLKLIADNISNIKLD